MLHKIKINPTAISTCCSPGDTKMEAHMVRSQDVWQKCWIKSCEIGHKVLAYLCPSPVIPHHPPVVPILSILQLHQPSFVPPVTPIIFWARFLFGLSVTPISYDPSSSSKASQSTMFHRGSRWLTEQGRQHFPEILPHPGRRGPQSSFTFSSHIKEAQMASCRLY